MRTAVAVLLMLGLSACGGGGGSSSTAPPVQNNPGAIGSTQNPLWTSGTFLPSSSYKSQCAVPRAGTSDVTGSSARENFWLRSWTNETYLWYSEVPDLNPASYQTSAYFPLLKTSAATASGNPKDQFHFTYATSDWLALSQSGVQSGYGVQWFVAANLPPRRFVVAFVEPGSPAAMAGLARGDEVLTADGIDVINTTSGSIYDALDAFYPAGIGESHTFVLKPVAGSQYAVTLQSTNVVSTPVQAVSILTTTTGPVGYFVFNDHIATSEAQLVTAINTLKTANVTDLVLDIRYNGGGYLDIASELAYMIAGPVPTAGRTFEKLTFNSKNPTTDPVTGQALAPLPFHTTTHFGAAPGSLPTLGLPRVFVITGSGTCSASESIINSLRGVDVNVIQIGTTTCGKPYGFYPTDNCGTTYFSIQFKGVNAKNFGEYSDGFTPTNSVVGTIGEKLPGCAVNDDFSRVLGNPAEGRLAAALQYRALGTCPTAPTTGPIGFAKAGGTAVEEGYLIRPPAREIRILRAP